MDEETNLLEKNDNLLETNEIFDCLIVGSGSAGATAGLYCSRSCLKNILFTGEQKGGLLTTTHIVENFPACYPAVSGTELMDIMLKQAEHYGTKIKNETCINIEKINNIFILKTYKNTYKGKTVIWATGSTPKKLEVPGEKKYENMGISYCATCDGFFFRNKEVAVVGGGNSALEEALFLSQIVSRVHLIHRRKEFRGEKVLYNQVINHEKITLHLDSVIEEILGNENNIESLKIRNLMTNVHDNLKIEGLFIAIGHTPNTQLIKSLIKTDNDGYVIAENTKTNVPGFFVAGDVQDNVYRQAVTAAASGCIAALEVIKFIQ